VRVGPPKIPGETDASFFSSERQPDKTKINSSDTGKTREIVMIHLDSIGRREGSVRSRFCREVLDACGLGRR
jgi:hypothetical protein